MRGGAGGGGDERFFYNGLYGGSSALYGGHCRALELVSSLARVRNIERLFQSNVCKLFLLGIWLLSVLS